MPDGPNSRASDQSNTYRQNVQGRGVFSSPDLSACEVTVDLTNCRSGKAKVAAAVYNGGATPAKPGVTVTFYAVLQNGQTALIGTGTTKTTRKHKPKHHHHVRVALPTRAMLVASRWRPHFALSQKRKRAVSKHDHDQARRADRKEELAMSRTEPSAYSRIHAKALTLR